MENADNRGGLGEVLKNEKLVRKIYSDASVRIYAKS